MNYWALGVVFGFNLLGFGLLLNYILKLYDRIEGIERWITGHHQLLPAHQMNSPKHSAFADHFWNHRRD